MRFWRRSAPAVEREQVVTEATRARIQAERDLESDLLALAQTRRETPIHRALAAQLAVWREENHIGAMVLTSIKGNQR